MKKRILSLLLAFAMLLGMFPTGILAGEQSDPFTVVVSMEGLTLGQGLYFEPKAYTLDEINALVKAQTPYTKETLTAGIATQAFLLDHNMEYQMSGTWESGAYLQAVKGIDTGTVKIPAVISEQDGAPSDEENDGNDDAYLGEFDYSMMAGWMLTVNDFMIDTGCADWKFTDQENQSKYVSKLGNTYVVRWQFSLWGYGADLGVDPGWGMPAYFDGANKAGLYAAYAASRDAEKKAAALSVMENLTASQKSVNDALALLTAAEPETVSVTGVELDQTELLLEAGSEQLLTAAVKPANADDQTVIWKSSDESVASVEDGLVTAVSAGSAVITVTTADGGFSDTCTVTVQKAQEPVPDDYKTVTVKVAPATVDVTFFGENASEAWAYVEDNGVNGKYHEYTLSAPAGTFFYRASDGQTDLGGMEFTVSDEAEQSVTLIRTNFYTTNKAITAIGDYTVEVLPGSMDPVVCGAQYLDGSSRVVTPTLLWANGNAMLYNWKITLNGALADTYGVALSINNTFADTLSAAQNKTFTLSDMVSYTIVAPAGAKVQMFNQIKNFNVEEIPETSHENTEDGMISHVFRTPASNNLTYRVSMEGKITRAGFMGTAEKTEPVVIEFLKNEDTKSTENITDNANLKKRIESSTLLNINGQNHLSLGRGKTYRVRAYRSAWAIINSDTANIMIEPDFHYNILSGAEHISMKPADNRCTGNAGGNWMDITGVSDGIAVLEVSYDAIQIGGSGTAYSGQYGATDPARTSLVVIDVNGSSGELTMKAKGSENLWDTEYDTVYTLEDTASLTFSAALDGEVPTVSLSTDQGTSWKTVAPENGYYTASGLVPGNNILRFTAGGKTNYQVVRAAKVTYTLTNDSRTGDKILAGDSVSVVFDGIYQPAPKFAGIYNPGFGGKPPHAITYTLPEDVTAVLAGGQYDFRTSNKITLTFPTAGTYELKDGSVHFNIMGVNDPLGGHRVLTDAGVGANFSAVSTSHIRCAFPDLTFTVQPADNTCEHVWGDCIVTTAHSAAKAGQKRYTCSLCGEYKFEATAKGACAKFSEEVAAVEPTCTEAGHNAGTRCSQCFKVLSGMETIPAKDHTEEPVTGTPATCTESGLTDGKKCSVCGETLAEQTVIPALGHEWKNGHCTRCNVEQPKKDYKPILDATLEQLSVSVPAPAFGTGAGEWTVLALARGEFYPTKSSYFADYYDRVAETAAAQAASVGLNGALHKAKSTENARLILALSAIGKNAHNVSGVDLVAAYSKNGFSWIAKQGINGPIFALLALDSVGYETEDSTLRQQCVDYILNNQLEDGGWALSGTSADPDITSMALQALAAYSDDAAVKAAAEKAFARLSAMQKDNGGFASWGTVNSESIAQVIVACTAWGIYPDTDERFVKNGWSAVDALLDYYVENEHAFAHVLDPQNENTVGAVNGMATDQAAYALVAYDRFKNGKTRLYDMSDVVTEEQEAGYEALLQQLTDALDGIRNAKQKAYYLVKDAGKAYTDYLSQEDYSALSDEQRNALQEAYDKLQPAFNSYLDKARRKAREELKKAYLAVDTGKLSADAVAELDKIYEDAMAELLTAPYEEALDDTLENAVYEFDRMGSLIRVTFCLVGCEQAAQEVNLSKSSYLPEYITWIPNKAYSVKKDALVYDVFVKAIEDYHLDQRGAENNYVEAIKAPSVLGGYWLGEFDNGKNSGWMYTLNGKHPSLGLKEQKLKDGDVIIWHYVNDYAHEVSDWFDDASHPSLGDGTYYDGWLNAPNMSPEQYVRGNMDKIVRIIGKGTVEPELKYADLGKKITFTFLPEAGQHVSDVIVDGVSVGAVESYECKHLSFDTRITVVFAGDKTHAFADVPTDAWYAEAVGYAADRGLMNGVSVELFDPDGTLSRAMLAAILYRMAGQPAVSSINPFTDVKSGQWYTDAIVWAAETGVVTGYGNGVFGINDPVTREQIAVMLRRFAALNGVSTESKDTLTGFADVSSVSAWAEDAMAWAVENGLIQGNGNLLNPTGTAARNQIAVILMRYCEKIAK